MKLILASGSAARRAMLDAAGIAHEAMSPGVDEDAAKVSLRAEGAGPRQLADALAELKAMRLSRRIPDALVLGCDSVVHLEDGTVFDKPESRNQAADQLRSLRGKVHRLTSAAVICERGEPTWRHVDVAKLQVRDFSAAFLDDYLDSEWPAIGGCVGGYRVEGRGAQLFDRIEGSQYTILGLPLLPLLAHLRIRGLLID